MENKLLDVLLTDQKNVADIYKPGPYWLKKSLSAIREIKKNGIDNLRSSTDINSAASSYGDNTVIDARTILETTSLQNRLGLAILNHTPLKRLFDFQVDTTRNLLKTVLRLEKNELALSNPERLSELIEKYKLENSINLGCDRISTFKNKDYSKAYLECLDLIDIIEKKKTLKECNSFLEIGPGFGANIHLIEQNFSNIRKFIVIDIVPNVWVVTEYLRKLYGESVKDYLLTRKLKEIKFKDDTSLEIFVIPPWEIVKIISPIDCFWNANSFVEMSPKIVMNYAEEIKRIGTKKSLYNFITYDEFDPKTTFLPDKIQEYFIDIKFEKFKHITLQNSDRENYFYIGKIV